MAEKIKESKEKPEAKVETKKKYEDMTPEERREALKKNYPDAWKGLQKALLAGEKTPEEDSAAPQEEEDANRAETQPLAKESSDISPVRVTASGAFDEDHSFGGYGNIVTTTITVSFWNVGSQVPGYGDASMHTRSVSSFNGASVESTCSGTFSGGPNGALRFHGECDGTTLGLTGGSRISADGMSLTVANPSAFGDWEK